MCGINGFSWKDARLIDRMNGALKHRGPDDQDSYIDEMVSLGHRRLSIIDLSRAGRQPMCNEDGSAWIVFNGEIYNFQELREDLLERGHGFRSNTDTEAIIHAYEEWGVSCVERFNGMWDFAIYDKKNSRLFLSRDRFGVKPLYYFCDDRGIIFSSEIKGILQHNIKREPNDRIAYQYLAFGIVNHCRETFFKGICSLMPGENLIYDLSNRSMRLHKWYDLRERLNGMSPQKEQNLAEKVRDLFEDSIRYRLISDVPVGSCLSGGIDSSSIVCSMRNIARGSIIKTFSLVFPGLPMDESLYIDEVVRDTDLEAHAVTPTQEELIEDIDDLIWTQEEPFGTLSIYGQYRVMKLASQKGMKVLLDGQGGDEDFAGYSKYIDHYLFECLKSLRISEFIKNFRAGFLFFAAITLLGKTGPTRMLLNRIKKRKAGYFLQEFYEGDTDYPLFKSGFGLNSALLEDITTYSIPHLLRYEDRNSMRWSIESRVPFMDYRLVEFAAPLAPDKKINQGVTKYIFREAMRGLVPESILNRRDKIGFATPDRIWFRNPEFTGFLRRIIDSEKLGSRPYWKRGCVKRLFAEHIEGRKDNSGVIWRIINMEIWLRLFIDAQEPSNSPKLQPES